MQANAAPGVKCLSAIKGIDFDENGTRTARLPTHASRAAHTTLLVCKRTWRRGVTGVVLISDIIRKEFAADCSVLMGANVANEVAKGDLADDPNPSTSPEPEP